MAGLSGWHLLILLAALVLLFGAKRLPDMARAVGQSARIFKGEMKGAAAEEHTPSPQQAPAASPAIEQHPHPVAPAHQPTADTTHPPTL
ncbi:MAG: Sec-independent protein translocase subunit TatA [Pseudonocardiaceae bacterium]